MAQGIKNIVSKEKPKVTPMPVVIEETTKPIPVIIEPDNADDHERKHDTRSMSPTTTEQQDITTAGQRRVNLIWERTQAVIALMVCLFTMVAAIMETIATVFHGKTPSQIPTIFAVAFGTVIGFYFSRTNHQAIGGTGVKANESQKYAGR